MIKKRVITWMALLTAFSFLAGMIAVTPLTKAESSSASKESGSFFSNSIGEEMASTQPKEYITVCENNRYALKFRQDIAAFAVENKQTGKVQWNAAVTQDLYNVERSTKTWKDYMQSLLAITYASRAETRGNFIKAYSSSDKNTISVQRFSDGLRVKTEFSGIGIVVTAEIRLDEDGVRVRLPADGITETGDYNLLSVELLPFFGAATSEEPGYIFYPDGSGALSYFTETTNKHLYTTSLSMDVYGTIEHAQMLSKNDVPSAMLPVYGVKKGEQAFLAAVVEGDAYSRVLVNPAVKMSPVKLNRASFEFVYRHQYRIYLSNIVVNGKSAASNLYGIKMEPEKLDIDREVKLFFLDGDKADYSGMANVYRDFLLQTGKLVKSKIHKTSGLSLTLFMGAKEESGLLKNVVATTTLPDAYKIITQYSDDGVDDLQVILRGWSKNGYGQTPEVFQPAGSIGGKSNLKNLDSRISENNALRLYLEMDLLNATDGVGGFYSGRDAILQGNSIPVTDSTRKHFLMTPQRVLERFNKAISKLHAYSNIGYALQGVGSRLYHDSNTKRLVNRQQTESIWKELVSKQDKSISVEGGNLYVLSAADRLYNIPIESSGSQLADEDIPWYQMVVYGSIPYSSEPGNLSYDLNRLKLKWIEYGCTPHFELTEQNPTLLKNSSYNELFTSENSKWHERVLAMYQEFADRLRVLEGMYITHHQRLTENVFKVTYSNGAEVFINYGETAAQADGITIAAQDYMVIGGDGK